MWRGSWSMQLWKRLLNVWKAKFPRHCVSPPRFAEEAKRTLAEALEAFLEVYYHRVHLLTHHRGCITPSSKDFALATLMSSEETLKRSLEETKERTASEPSMPCKRRRLRPMPPSALCGFDIEEGLGANLGESVLEVANPSTPSAYTIPPADGSVVTEMADWVAVCLLFHSG